VRILQCVYPCLQVGQLIEGFLAEQALAGLQSVCTMTWVCITGRYFLATREDAMMCELGRGESVGRRRAGCERACRCGAGRIFFGGEVMQGSRSGLQHHTVLSRHEHECKPRRLTYQPCTSTRKNIDRTRGRRHARTLAVRRKESVRDVA